jgi:hypothetical protein
MLDNFDEIFMISFNKNGEILELDNIPLESFYVITIAELLSVPLVVLGDSDITQEIFKGTLYLQSKHVIVSNYLIFYASLIDSHNY